MRRTSVSASWLSASDFSFIALVVSVKHSHVVLHHHRSFAVTWLSLFVCLFVCVFVYECGYRKPSCLLPISRHPTPHSPLPTLLQQNIADVIMSTSAPQRHPLDLPTHTHSLMRPAVTPFVTTTLGLLYVAE